MRNSRKNSPNLMRENKNISRKKGFFLELQKEFDVIPNLMRENKTQQRRARSGPLGPETRR